MDRVPYRRITPPRDCGIAQHFAKPRLGNRKIFFGETVIVQLIISGILIVSVFLICLVDIGPLMSLRGGLRQVLAGATTVEAFTAEVRHFSREWLNTEPEPVTELLDLPVFYIPEPSFIDTQYNLPEAYEQYYHLQPAPTAYDEHSNPQIPGPLTSPGLWD